MGMADDIADGLDKIMAPNKSDAQRFSENDGDDKDLRLSSKTKKPTNRDTSMTIISGVGDSRKSRIV